MEHCQASEVSQVQVLILHPSSPTPSQPSFRRHGGSTNLSAQSLPLLSPNKHEPSTNSSYLGDQLQQFAYPVLLFAHTLFHPVALLSPLANYVFLRYLGGDKENEANQLERYKDEDEAKYEEFQVYRRQKNAFWPSVSEVTNGWVWVVAGWGFLGIGVERVVRRLLANRV